MRTNVNLKRTQSAKFIRLIALIGGFCLSFSVQAETKRSYLPHEKYELENGLEVILHQDMKTGSVAVSLWAHVGGLNEKKGRSGFAHLFEHLMFQGTPHVGDDMHFKYLHTYDMQGTKF